LISSSSSTEALWLETLNRISGRAAHELKGVLNGVSVNLEVIRSRAGKPDAPASAVATFANSAATQFEAVMDMTEGLLTLARAGSGAVDVGQTTRRIAALLEPVARADGRSLRVDSTVDLVGTTAADANAVRLAVGAVLLGAIESCTAVQCEGRQGALRISGTEGALAAPRDDIVAATRDAGLEVQAERSAISITFPR
jgi:signal transduction histidine kinase